jgi:regulator of protease activity HflC (stomatin/prohibitin superfamily)
MGQNPTSRRAIGIMSFVVAAILIVAIVNKAYVGIAIIAVVILGILYSIFCVRIINEPDQPIIWRGGQMHHLGQPGVNLLIPIVESIQGTVDTMTQRSQKFEVHQVATGDGSSVYMNLELDWRFHPDIYRIDYMLKQTFLRSEEQLEALVDQTVTIKARHLVQQYTSDTFKDADTRQRCVDILRQHANQALAAHGIIVDHIFWRGSIPKPEVLKARREISIEQERLRAMITEVQIIQEKLPNVSAEQFLTFRAWLELLRHGIPAPLSPPNIPGMPAGTMQPPSPSDES